MPRSHGSKFSQAMCGKQGSQSDGWARKSQQHTQDQSTFKKGRGHAASVAPSHSLGDTQPAGHSQVCQSHASGPPVVVPEWRLWVAALLWPVPTRQPGSISATVLRSTTLAGQPGHSPQPPAAGALGSTGRPWEGRGKRAAFCWGTVREHLPCAGRSRGPKHCRAQKNGINIRKRTSLVTSLKTDYCCRGLVLFFLLKPPTF